MPVVVDDRFAGLNLPQLLELMAEVVVPEPVSLFPQTIGWGIVALFVLAVLVVLYVQWLREYRRNAYRRQALRELSAVENRWKAGDGADPSAVAAIVRRAALAAYPRGEVAALYGPSWEAFLRRTAGDTKLVDRDLPLLSQLAYRAAAAEDLEMDRVLVVARRWVEAHRA